MVNIIFYVLFRFEDVLLFIQLYTKINQGSEVKLGESIDQFKIIEVIFKVFTVKTKVIQY